MATSYRIQKRKFSTNSIEYSQDDGHNWKYLMGVVLPKKVGDMLIEEFLEHLVHSNIGVDLENEILTD